MMHLLSEFAPTRRGCIDDEEPDVASSDVSTEEHGPEGDLPGADLNYLNDKTDDAHLYLNKFSSYSKILDLLEDEHDYRIAKFPPKVAGHRKI